MAIDILRGDAPIAKKFRQMSEELGQLRLNTIASVRIDEKGTLSAFQSPGLTALQEKIAEEEQRLERMVEIGKEIGVEFAKTKMPSSKDLRDRLQELRNTIESGPAEAWQLFNQTRGEGGVGANMRVYWLPSDLCQVPEFKAQEARIRSQIEAAKAEIGPMQDALRRIQVLEDEAMAL